jgi:multidrug resistance efflux pump
MSLQTPIRLTFTLSFLLIAVLLAHLLWREYMYAPWTRDGRVRADVINIAPDVSGLVTQVPVADNQLVHRGDVLFVIDPARFHDALAQADAEVVRANAQVDTAQALVAQRQSEWSMRQQQALRRSTLSGDVISSETRSDYDAQMRQALAVYQASKASLEAAKGAYQASLAAQQTARLNLERSVVRSPADGYVANLDLFTGDYAAVGVARIAIVDVHSFWVYGYFEETKIPKVRVGAQASIRLLASRVVLNGHVESIASGISDRDNPTGSDLLANVDPIFTWVRLAQRVPVRVAIDHVPDGVHLASGMTCTVTLQADK